jgi:ABC-type amino acid transport substrate-binding protein
VAEQAAPEERGAGISKVVAIVIAVVLLVVGIGIGYGIGVATTPAPQLTWESTIEKVYKTGVLVVGTDAAFPPFESVNTTTGEIEGFDVEIMQYIADYMGVELEMRNIGWDAIFTAVPQRTVDMAISAMTITEERKQLFDFSMPYFFSNLTVVIKAGGPMEGVINSKEDLAGKKIAYQEFTTSEGWVQDTLIAELGIQPSETIATALFTDAIQMLVSEEVDAVIIDEPVAKNFEQAGAVTIVETIITNETFGIPMPKGEKALKAIVDAALREMFETGKYDEIFDKWFGP